MRCGRKNTSKKIQERNRRGVIKSRVKLGNEISGRGDSFKVGQSSNSYSIPFEVFSAIRTPIKVLPNNCFGFAINVLLVEFAKQTADSFALAHDNAFFNFSFTTIRAL